MSADRVHIVGVGACGRSSLTSKAAEIVDGADLLVGGDRLLAMFPESVAEKISLVGGFEIAIDRIKAALGSRRVVVLASGDPGFFGIARPLVERLGRERVEVIPNVSSLQLAFARLGESWEDAAFASVHGRPLEGLEETVRSNRKIAILTGGKQTPAVVARWLLDAGIDGYRVYLCEDLGGPEERVLELDLERLAAVETALLNVVVLIKQRDVIPAAATRRLLFGRSDEEYFHMRGMITKAEVRAASLSKMGLEDGSTIWDVGAGSGSVAVESAMFARNGRVYAVERDPDQVLVIQKNLAKFNVENVVVIQGEAPEALDELPPPDAVFVGGSGGRLAAILDIVCSRLHVDGRVVVNASTLETAGVALSELRARNFEPEVAVLQVSRGKQLGSLTHLEALNPVFIVSGCKPQRLT